MTRQERERFEPPLGTDLGGVRIHDGPPAAAAAADERAHAFAYGSHIVLGRTAQKASGNAYLAVLAHELIHVGQQATRVPANDDRFDHQPRGPSDHQAVPTLTIAAPAVMRLAEDDDSLIPGWASDAANAVAEAGAGAFNSAADAAGSVTEFAVDTAASVIDELAPGLLPFLRGGALGRLTDLFCSGIDSLLGTLFASLGELDFMSAIEALFSNLATGVRQVQDAIGSTASDALGTVLGPLVAALQAWGGPLVATIQSVATAVNGLFSTVWDGLAVPALDILERIGGAAWQGFNDLVTWVWDLAEPIRTGAETAWNWLLDTFDLAWDSTAGVRDWLADTASAAWTAFLETIEPIRGPLETAGGIALLLSPVGPIVVLTQIVPPLWEKIAWLWNNWNTADILVRAQDVLRDDVLPAILTTVGGIAQAAGNAATWLSGLVGEFAGAMHEVVGTFGANSCLAAVTTYLNGVAGQFNRLAAWAESGFAGLSDALGAVFDALVAFFQPILDFLVRLSVVALMPPMLPFALVGAVWLLCPRELKSPVIDFVLDLLIAFIDGSTVFLVGLGPMGLVMQAGALAFMRELRGGEAIDDDRRIDASNKIASLAAGGGPAFVLGFSLGFLHGVVDGIIDPFRLVFLLARLLFAGAQVIGRAFAPYVMATVPGAEGAVAGLRDSLAVPPAGLPEATDPETSASAVPDSGAADMAELPSVAPQPGDAGDAEIVAALGPGMGAEAAALANEPAVDDSALADAMRGEMEAEGKTVGGLARLLGEGWAWIMQGSDRIGRAAANAFIDFILQSDFELGRTLGFVSGFIALQALIIYLSAGGYAALKGVEPFCRQLLIYILRFLDLGGEILGVLGRALRPLRGPLMTGLGTVRTFLGRFRFARGLVDMMERLAGTLFRFGDEAAEVGGRAAREGTEAAGGRAARETADRATAEAAEHASREGAEAAGARAAREATEAGAGRTAAEGLQDANGVFRSVDEPGMRTVRNDALKAAELPEALVAARLMLEASDRAGAPIPAILASLILLKGRYTWIDTFTATPTASAIYAVDMIASRHRIGFPRATLRGVSLSWLRKNKPRGWREVPTREHEGWIWLDANGVERLRFMRPSGSNPMASRWARQANGYFRWQDEAGNFLDIDGNIVAPNNPLFQELTHIMYEGL